MDNAQLDALMKSLEAQINNIVNDSLVKDVQPKTVKLIQDEAFDKFYNSYKPSTGKYGYNRTYSLLQDSSYKVDWVKNGFKISSNDFYGDKNMFLVANEGKKYGLWDRYSRDVTDRFSLYNRDSHFLDSSFAKLNGGLACQWLRESLISKGINCR